MAELGLKDRLQPALLDRLIDEERHVTRVQVTVRPEVLDALRLSLGEFTGILAAQGLRRDDRTEIPSQAEVAQEIVLHFVSLGSEFNPGQLKARVIRPPGRAAGIALQECCEIQAHTSINRQLDLGENAYISMRRLRESVQRDLGWLLNCASLDSLQDLSRYPQVARSVLNYGMPTLSGKIVSKVDIAATSQRIQEVIQTFEPRLSRVQVTPEAKEQQEEAIMAFRIEAELWGQPVPQYLVLRTHIDIESGAARVSEMS